MPARVFPAPGAPLTASIYLLVHDADAAQPTPAQVRDRLAALEKPTVELLKTVEKTRPAFDFIAAEICPDGRVDCLIQQIAWLDRLESDLRRLQSVARSAVTTENGTKKKARTGHPKENCALAFFAQALGDIYHECTSRKPSVTWHEYRQQYEGDFFALVEACLEPLGPDHTKSNNALGKAIQRALKGWKPPE